MFLQSRYKVGLHYACRGTMLIGATNLSPVTIFGRALAQRWMQSVSKPEIYPGAGLKLRADVGFRVPKPITICLGDRNKSKNCDEPIIYTVRVSCCAVLKYALDCRRSNSKIFNPIFPVAVLSFL